MKGCMYISPQSVATLIADTLVTFEGSTKLDAVLPATLNPESYTANSPVLARKIYILSEKSAVACAGPVSAIADFLENARGLISIFEQDERPMRRIGDLANQYSKLEVIGAHVRVEEDGKWCNNIVAPSGTVLIPNYEICAYSGSGGYEMASLVRQYGSHLSGSRIKHPYELIRGTVGAINNHKIRREILFSENDSSWGGYLEYVVFDLARKKCRWGLKSAHLFGESKIVGDEINISVLDKVIVYNPGEYLAQLLVLNPLRTDKVFGWTLKNVLVNDSIRPETDFNGWHPESATITIMDRRRLNFITSTLHFSEMHEVEFDFNKDFYKVRIKESFLRRFAERAYGLTEDQVSFH